VADEGVEEADADGRDSSAGVDAALKSVIDLCEAAACRRA
jgi:hypothetical protein